MDLKASAESRWFRRFQPRPHAAGVLVCLPHAGGAASTWFSFATHLPERVEVLAVQYPGRQNRLNEPCLDSVPALARGAARDLAAQVAGRPYALVGHSMGAAVAFEMARLTEAAGLAAPHTLFLSGRSAPSVRPGGPVAPLDDDALVAEMRALNGTQDQVFAEPDLLPLLLPSFRADHSAAKSYAAGPEAVVRADIVAFTGDTDPEVGPGEATAWRMHTSGAFEERVLPGGHFFLFDHEAEIAAAVAARCS